MSASATDTLQQSRKERLVTTASSNSTVYRINNKSKVSVHLILDNTDEVGTLKVQVSNDPDLSSWATVWYRDSSDVLQTAGSSVTSGTDVNWLLDPLDSYAQYLRVSYTRTSGGDAARFIYIYVHEVTR
jgi:hypothetical protein